MTDTRAQSRRGAPTVSGRPYKTSKQVPRYDYFLSFQMASVTAPGFIGSRSIRTPTAR